MEYSKRDKQNRQSSFHNETNRVNKAKQLLNAGILKEQAGLPLQAKLNNDSTIGHPDVIQKKQAVPSSNQVIQRHEIEGPWDKGSPVHENLTLQSLIKAGLVEKDTQFDDEEVFEYMRGVIWNDDPEGLLFDNNEKDNNNYSSGLMWFRQFRNGKKSAQNGHEIDAESDNITGRSHFGDLQFLHSMAIADGIMAEVTRNKVMMWAEFTYKVGIKEIPSNTKLSQVSISGFQNYFGNSSLGKLTIDDLFHTHDNGDSSKRAMGSLMHMIQDSHAHGHTERVEKKGDDPISNFRSYINQDGHEHAKFDQANGDFSYEGLSKLKGAKSAMDKGAKVLKMYSQKCPWNVVKIYLENEVFNLVSNPAVSGPGAEFEKDDH